MLRLKLPNSGLDVFLHRDGELAALVGLLAVEVVEGVFFAQVSVDGRRLVLEVDFLLKLSPESLGVLGRRAHQQVVDVADHPRLRRSVDVDPRVALHHGPAELAQNFIKFSLPAAENQLRPSLQLSAYTILQVSNPKRTTPPAPCFDCAKP